MSTKSDQNDEQVTITFTGAMSLSRTISFRRATEIAGLLANADASPVSSMLPTHQISVTNSNFASSPLEAVKKSNAKTFPQLIVTLAHYLTIRDKSDTFDPKAVQVLLGRMGNPPKNFTRDLQTASDLLGYLMRQSKHEYIVTDKGREMVLSGFDGAVEGVTRRRKIKRLKGKKSQE